MYASIAAVAFAALAIAEPIPSAVSSAVAPTGSPPPGCYYNYQGKFSIAPVNISSSSKRDLGLESRQASTHNELYITLNNGVLTDNQGRTGYVAANGQFQFDSPPQAGAQFTAGFSVCQNKSLAIGGTTSWEKCKSGAGPTSTNSFFNLYLNNGAGYCIPSYILAEPAASGDGPVAGQGGLTSGVLTTTGSSSMMSSSMSSMMSSSMSSAMTTSMAYPATGTGAMPSMTSSASSSAYPVATGAASKFSVGGVLGAVGGLLAYAAL